MSDDLTEHQLALIGFLQKWEAKNAFGHETAHLCFCTPIFRATRDVVFINDLGCYKAEINNVAESFGLAEIIVSRVHINTIDQ